MTLSIPSNSIMMLLAIALRLSSVSGNSPFLRYWLVTSLEIIDIGNIKDLKVREVLVTCISNIDFQ